MFHSAPVNINSSRANQTDFPLHSIAFLFSCNLHEWKHCSSFKAHSLLSNLKSIINQGVSADRKQHQGEESQSSTGCWSSIQQLRHPAYSPLPLAMVPSVPSWRGEGEKSGRCWLSSSSCRPGSDSPPPPPPPPKFTNQSQHTTNRCIVCLFVFGVGLGWIVFILFDVIIQRLISVGFIICLNRTTKKFFEFMNWWAGWPQKRKCKRVI